MKSEIKNSDVDVVVTWVDPTDADWNRLREEFSSSDKYEHVSDFSLARYRDWDNLRYWFRGIEKFMPWIRKVHFVTHGHIPDWLDINHEKLNVVKHSDYIDRNFLPTFNSRVIELNLPFLSDLSEKFILFNDDLFLIDSIGEDCFFKNGLPRDAAILNAYSGGGLSPVQMNDLFLINRFYSKRYSIFSNVLKWFDFRYGSNLLRSLLLLPWPKFTGFVDFHLPQPYLKSNLRTCWRMYRDDILITCNSRFRLKSDINHYIFRYNHLAAGHFSPVNPQKFGKYFQVNEGNAKEVAEYIRKKSTKIVVINDSEMDDFEFAKKAVNDAFDEILPEKSGYEI
jgi:hypothetical protein